MTKGSWHEDYWKPDPPSIDERMPPQEIAVESERAPSVPMKIWWGGIRLVIYVFAIGLVIWYIRSR